MFPHLVLCVLFSILRLIMHILILSNGWLISQVYLFGPLGSYIVCCSGLKIEFGLCDGVLRQWYGIIHYHKRTVSIKPRLLFISCCILRTFSFFGLIGETICSSTHVLIVLNGSRTTFLPVCISARFVVLAQDCLYVFRSANDKRPAKMSFSMSAFVKYVLLYKRCLWN